jgi:uncharacterized membrane protein
VESVNVSTVVYLPPEEVYEFLLDFPRYARYSEYLQEVTADGDGGPGTRYDLTFGWWKLTYTAHSEVTGVDPPERIDWRLVEDIDAEGYWEIEPEPDTAPPDAETACRVRLVVAFDPDSADAGVVELPAFVSLDWLIDKVRPKIRAEAKQVVERIVADLEGERREVELTVHENGV